MSLQARGHRHFGTFWRGEKPWQWWALKYGWAQPKRFVWIDRYRWRFHLTPIHLERWDSYTEIGLCFGKRTLMLLGHR